MGKFEVKNKENPKLMQNKLTDGRLSLYLEYYLGRKQFVDEVSGKTKIKHDRKKEFLNLYLLEAPKSPIDREANRKITLLAQEIRAEREQELKADRTGKRVLSDKKINFLDYFQSYIDNYKKKDVRMLIGVLARFKNFLERQYPLYKNNIRPAQINKDMMLSFVDYLESNSKGEGARGYFQRFKKVVKYAVENNVIQKNPCTGVVCKVDETALKKDILSLDEMHKLLSTTYHGQNQNTRRAFIFCLYTGIRYCDVIELKFSDVDYSNKLLKFEQVKTKGHSSSSWVSIPLNEGLLKIIGTKPEKYDFIFKLPSHTMCLKALDRWVKNAKIDKHITWHSARHSFAVNILNNGANIKTVASLLGHSGLKHTEKYTRAVDSLKEKAINSLPEIII